MIARLLAIGLACLLVVAGIAAYVYYAELNRDLEKPSKLVDRLLADAPPEPEEEPIPDTFQGEKWPLVEGEPFPDLTFTGVDGQPVKLSQFKGRPMLIEAAAMSCPGSVASAGGEKAGSFRGCAPQPNGVTLDALVHHFSGGFSIADPRLLVVEIIFYNDKMEAPSREDLVAWRDHFAAARAVEPFLLGAPQGLPSATTMPLIPGLYVVDRDFRVIHSHRGGSPDVANIVKLCRSLPRLVDPPPTELPKPSSAVVEKVAKAFLANPSPTLPHGPELVTNASQLGELAAARKRVFLDLYRVDAPGSEKYNDDAKTCIDIMAKHAIARVGMPVSENVADARAAGQRAADAGCADPIFLQAYAGSLPPSETKRVTELLRQSTAALRAGDYPAETQFHVALDLVGALRRMNDRAPAEQRELAALLDSLVPLYAKALAQPNVSPVQREMLLSPLATWMDRPAIFADRIWAVYDAVRSEPGVDPWAIDIVSGTCHVEEAWRQRGAGFAHTITAEGFDGFQKHCVAAGACFASAWCRRPDLPLAANGMLRVLLSGETLANETMRFWFCQSVAARFDNIRAYESMMWALRPRWFGSHQKMLDLGQECLDTGRFDTLVPYVYARAVFDVAGELDDQAERVRLFARPDVSERLFKLYRGLLADPSWNEYQRRQFRTELAIAAYLADKIDICREEAKQLEGQYDLGAFDRFPVDPSRFQDAIGTAL